MKKSNITFDPFILRHNLNFMQRILIVFALFILIASCNNSKIETTSLDLIDYGISLTVNAPKTASVTQPSNSPEVWIVDSTSNFEIQIRKSLSLTNDLTKVKEEELSLVKSTTGFSKIISETDNGFIFEENFDETSYDFRYFVVQGDHKFIFQKMFTSNLTLEDVENIFEIISE